jgi:hypothetical protein
MAVRLSHFMMGTCMLALIGGITDREHRIYDPSHRNKLY